MKTQDNVTERFVLSLPSDPIVASPTNRPTQYRSQLFGVASAAHRKCFNEFNDSCKSDCRQNKCVTAVIEKSPTRLELDPQRHLQPPHELRRAILP
jgi:hypothetical protein